jgi:hypothetical protein
MATHEDHHDFQEIFRQIEDAKKYILIIDDGDHTHAYMRGCNLDYAHMLSGLFNEHPHVYELMHAVKEAHVLRDKMAEEMGEDEADHAIAVMFRAMFGDALEDGGEAPNPATHSMEDMLRELGLDNK